MPTTQRAALLTAAQLGSYDQIKHLVLVHTPLREGIALHAVCSFVAGFVSSAVTSPVDLVKTRLMNQASSASAASTGGGGPLYRGVYDCLQKTLRHEGLRGVYKGFWPNWLRITPHTVTTMLVYEQYRRWMGIRPV